MACFNPRRPRGRRRPASKSLSRRPLSSGFREGGSAATVTGRHGPHLAPQTPLIQLHPFSRSRSGDFLSAYVSRGSYNQWSWGIVRGLASDVLDAMLPVVTRKVEAQAVI